MHEASTLFGIGAMLLLGFVVIAILVALELKRSAELRRIGAEMDRQTRETVDAWQTRSHRDAVRPDDIKHLYRSGLPMIREFAPSDITPAMRKLGATGQIVSPWPDAMRRGGRS